MKKIISILAACMMFTAATASAADIAVEINGQYLGFDVPPTMQNDRVLVPMRAIFEAFGAQVDWNGNTQQIIATTPDATIEMKIDSQRMNVLKSDFTHLIDLDQPPVIIDGRTLVPARAVSEALDATVNWDGSGSTVKIDAGVGISATEAFFYKGNAYYSMCNEPAIYVWDGNTNYRYAAGGEVHGIVVYNDYIFYYNSTSGKICRMNLDGSDRRIMASAYKDRFDNSDPVFIIKSGKLYWRELDTDWWESGEGDSYRICEMDIEGGNKKILVEGIAKAGFSFFGAYNTSWAIGKNTIYYGIFPEGSASLDDPYWGCHLHSLNLTTGNDRDLNSLGVYTLYGLDGNGNVIFSNGANEENKEYYIINEKTDTFTPYSQFSQYADQWWYYVKDGSYEKAKTYRQHLSNGEYELLTDGKMLGKDDSTMLFAVSTLSYKEDSVELGRITNQEIYAMDLDGNNMRLVNEYSDDNGVVQSNTGFDNSQSSQQTTCAICHGSGTIDCSVCHGTGRQTQYYTPGYDDEDVNNRSCLTCGGRGKKTCIVCGGDGIVHD